MLELVPIAFQSNFLQVGYFLAVAALILKFFREKFQGRPVYFLVLLNDFLELTFVSLAIIIGFNLTVIVNHNKSLLEELQESEQEVIVVEDRIARALDAMNDDGLNGGNYEERATTIFLDLFSQSSEPYLEIVLMLEDNTIVSCIWDENDSDTTKCSVRHQG